MECDKCNKCGGSVTVYTSVIVGKHRYQYRRCKKCHSQHSTRTVPVPDGYQRRRIVHCAIVVGDRFRLVRTYSVESAVCKVMIESPAPIDAVYVGRTIPADFRHRFSRSHGPWFFFDLDASESLADAGFVKVELLDIPKCTILLQP